MLLANHTPAVIFIRPTDSAEKSSRNRVRELTQPREKVSSDTSKSDLRAADRLNLSETEFNVQVHVRLSSLT